MGVVGSAGLESFGGAQRIGSRMPCRCARSPSIYDSQFSGSYSYLHSEHAAPTDRLHQRDRCLCNTLPHARRSEPFVHKARLGAIKLHLCSPCLVLYHVSAGSHLVCNLRILVRVLTVGRPVRLNIISVLQRLSLPRGLCFASYPATVSCSASHAGLVIQLPLWSWRIRKELRDR